MFRTFRTAAIALLLALVIVPSFATAASAAEQIPEPEPTPDFGPPIEPGTIKSIVEGHGHVVIAQGPKPGWDVLFSNVGADDAAAYAERLNDTMHKAERLFDRKGEGNFDSPAEGAKFGVDQVGSKWVVHGPNGGVVAVYSSERKANAVANALNEEAEAIEKEEDECVDPWIFGGENPDIDRY